MDIEKQKLTDDVLENTELVRLCKKSYITKDDLIDIIQKLNFTEVANFSITCITGYKIELDSDGDKNVRTYSFDINLE